MGKSPNMGRKLFARLTGAAKKLAESTELKDIRQSTSAEKDKRDGIIAGVKQFKSSLERAMECRIQRRRAKCKSSSTRNISDHDHRCLSGGNLFEKAVLDMKSGRLTVELKNRG